MEIEYFINVFIINLILFFREVYYFDVLVLFFEMYLELLIIWCVVFSSGEEFYFIVMICVEVCGLLKYNIIILVFDIDSKMLDKVIVGVYFLV